LFLADSGWWIMAWSPVLLSLGDKVDWLVYDESKKNLGGSWLDLLDAEESHDAMP